MRLHQGAHSKSLKPHPSAAVRPYLAGDRGKSETQGHSVFNLASRKTGHSWQPIFGTGYAIVEERWGIRRKAWHRGLKAPRNGGKGLSVASRRNRLKGTQAKLGWGEKKHFLSHIMRKSGFLSQSPVTSRILSSPSLSLQVSFPSFPFSVS